jgi:GDP-D-mannose dehydratase
MTTALITGIAGEDGSYLAELLLEKGYRVDGTVQDAATANYGHIRDRVGIHQADLLDQTRLSALLRDVRPGEVYNLAVLATGETHSVRELCEEAFSYLGLDYREYVAQETETFRMPETAQLVGNPAKARVALGWKPEVSFRDLVRMMVDADLAALRADRSE